MYNVIVVIVRTSKKKKKLGKPLVRLYFDRLVLYIHKFKCLTIVWSIHSSPAQPLCNSLLQFTIVYVDTVKICAIHTNSSLNCLH